jgi:hypothetical protein
MTNSVVMAAAGVGSALMAAAGVFSTGRLAAAGAAVMFAAAAYKFFSGRHKPKAHVERPRADHTRVAALL